MSKRRSENWKGLDSRISALKDCTCWEDYLGSWWRDYTVALDVEMPSEEPRQKLLDIGYLVLVSIYEKNAQVINLN